MNNDHDVDYDVDVGVNIHAHMYHFYTYIIQYMCIYTYMIQPSAFIYVFFALVYRETYSSLYFGKLH